MRKSIYILLFFAIFAAPGSAFGWTEKLTVQAMVDANKFAPNKMRFIIRKHRPILNILAETGKKNASATTPDQAYLEAVLALRNSRNDPERAAIALFTVGQYLLDGTRPADSESILAGFEEASSCFQAEFDGFQPMTDPANRAYLSKRALAQSRVDVADWVADKGTREQAAEGVATAYHLAVNDLADMMAAAWKDATGDTANTTSKGKRIWHGKSPRGMLWLPNRHDPIPKLAAYYRAIGSSLSDARYAETGTRAPVPEGVYLLRFSGLRVITKGGQDQKSRWKHNHQPEQEESLVPVPEPLDLPESMESGNRPSSVQESDKATRSDVPELSKWGEGEALPMPSISSVSSIDKAESHEVTHERLQVQKSSGSLDADSVEKKMSALMPRLERCHSQAGGGLTGKVVISFTVDMTGKVRGAQVYENTTGSDRLGQCVCDTVKLTNFPKPADQPANIRYPFLFQ